VDNMTSNQPYLLKAFYDWIVDNNLTPYIVVDAILPGVEVPQQFVKEGQIVLNISPSACVNLHIELDAISFQARFSGQPMQVYVPSIAVSAIYARENGAGTVFTRSEEELASYEQALSADNTLQTVESNEASKGDDSDSKSKTESKTKRPSLKVVK
jgi:stringent starvation protein B